MGGGDNDVAAMAASGLNWDVLEDRVRECLRIEHYAYSTEQTYLGWIKRFVAFNGWRKVSVRRTPSSEILPHAAYYAHERKNFTWKRINQDSTQARTSGRRW